MHCSWWCVKLWGQNLQFSSFQVSLLQISSHLQDHCSVKGNDIFSTSILSRMQWCLFLIFVICHLVQFLGGGHSNWLLEECFGRWINQSRYYKRGKTNIFGGMWLLPYFSIKLTKRKIKYSCLKYLRKYFTDDLLSGHIAFHVIRGFDTY